MTRKQTVLFGALLFCSGFNAAAQVDWNGSGDNDNWNNGFNWVGQSMPQSDSTTWVRFPFNANRRTPVVNGYAPWILNRLDLAGTYSLTGNKLSFQGLGPKLNASGVSLVISNDIDIPSQILTIDGSGSDPIALKGTITGSGGLKTRVPLTLSGTNPLTGPILLDTQVSQWAITVTNGAALGPSGSAPVEIRTGQLALSGGITVSGKSLLLGTGLGYHQGLISVAGDNTWTGPIDILTSSYASSNTPGKTLTITGPVDGHNQASLDFGGDGDVVFAGPISNLTQGISKGGTGTVTLSGINTYTVQTTISKGTVVLKGGYAIADTAAISFQVFGPDTPILRVEDDETIGALWSTAFNNCGVVELGSHTLTVNQVYNLDFWGTLTGSGSLVKTGTGRLELVNPNSYTGGTVIVSGSVQFDSMNAIAGKGSNVLVHSIGMAIAGFPISQQFLDRLDPNSSGLIAIAKASVSDLDFGAAGLGNVRFAAVGPQSYGGALSPARAILRLGGTPDVLALTRAGALNRTAFLDVGLAAQPLGRVVLTGDNAISDDAIINGGALEIKNAEFGASRLEVTPNTKLQLSAGGVRVERLTIDAGGVLSGCGEIAGEMINNGRMEINLGSDLQVSGPITNNGTIVVFGSGTLTTKQAFINNGVLDLLTSPTTQLPPDFVNNGTVIAAGAVKVRAVSRTFSNFSLQIESLVGHTYQLQRSSSIPATGWLSVGAPQSSPNGADLLLSDYTANEKMFYRVQISP